MPANKMLCSVIAVVCAVLVLPVHAESWQTVGSLTDPCDLAVTGYLDITQAWVEKSGTQLKFVMILRDALPTATGSPGDDNIYIWYVDADNNPNTSQSAGTGIGNEFNVRSWVGHEGIGGYVDVVGQWAAPGGPAVTTISGNRVEIVVEMPQIMSPDLFHFRCESFQTVGGFYFPGNAATPASAECWVSRYAVLMDPVNVGFGVESNISMYKCDPCDPLNTAAGTLVIDKHTSNAGMPSPVFDAMEGHDDGNTPGTHKLFGQTMAVCDFLHLRTEALMDISSPETGAYGQVDAKAAGYQGFQLLSRDALSGPVPSGMFFIDIRHGYHVRGIEAEGKVSAQSFAQVLISDIEDPLPFQVKVWVDARDGGNTPLTAQRVDTIDLADLGMEFNRRYTLDTVVTDACRTNDASLATYSAQVAGHSDLVVSFRMAYPSADLNGDRVVDFRDMAVLASQWLVEK